LAAAALIAAASLATALLVDAFSYLASALLLLGLLPGSPEAIAPERRSLPSAIREAATYVLTSSNLRALFGASATVFLLLGMQGPLFFAFAAERLGDASEGFAIMMAALGIGALLGATLMARFSRLSFRPLRVLAIVLAVDAVALFFFTFAHDRLSAAFWMAVMGLISSFFSVIVRTFLQTAPPLALRSRVLGWFTALQGPCTALSLALAGVLTQVLSPVALLQCAAVAEFFVAFWLGIIAWEHNAPAAEI
jgi:hypothetical protein